METSTADLTINVTSKELSAIGNGMKLSVIRECLPELEQLCRGKIAASDAFADGCKAVAEKGGVHAAVLAAFVSAVVRDKLKDKQEKADQLSLLFEEIPA